MRNKDQRPESGERKVTVRELVESELDLIIGGAAKQPQPVQGEKTKKPGAG